MQPKGGFHGTLGTTLNPPLSRDVATAFFLLLASHYVFNLSYHSKLGDFLIFVQERIAKIPSSTGLSQKKRKEKSPVSLSHVNGIVRFYDSMEDIVSFDNID